MLIFCNLSLTILNRAAIDFKVKILKIFLARLLRLAFFSLAPSFSPYFRVRNDCVSIRVNREKIFFLKKSKIQWQRSTRRLK